MRLTTAATAISRRVRFSIPAGEARRLHVPLTGRGYRILRRKVARANARSEFGRDVTLVVDARTDDGARLPYDRTLIIAR